MKKFLFGYVIFTILLTLAILYPYSVRIQDSLPDAIDPVFYAWNLGHNYQSFLSGGKNLLDTNIFYPESNTLALSDTLFTQTVMVMPVLALTNNPVLAENVYILSTFVIAAITMFFLALYLTKSVAASAVSGIFFAFAVPRLAQIGHMPALGSQWVPLFFLFLFRYLESGSWKLLWLTFFAYLLNITSSMYFGIFLIPLIAIALLTQAITWIYRKHFKSVAGFFKPLMFSLLPMFVILFITLFPYVRLRAEYPGIKRSIDDTARLSAKMIDYLTVPPTSWLSDLGVRAAVSEEPLYPTMTLLALAAIGILYGWKVRKKYVVFFALSGTIAYLLSFGPYMDIVVGPYKWFHLTAPYYYLYQYVPFLQSVRVPARFSILVIFSLASLAAMGLSSIKAKKILYPVTLIALLLFLLEVWQVDTPSVRVPVGDKIPAVYQWLAKEPDSAIVAEVPFRPRFTLEPKELQLMHTYEETRDNNGYALETYRVYFSYFHRKRILNGYSSYFPQVYQDHGTLLHDFPTADAIDKLQKESVRYIVVHGSQYSDRDFADVLIALTDEPKLRKAAQFDSDVVYEIIQPQP